MTPREVNRLIGQAVRKRADMRRLLRELRVAITRVERLAARAEREAHALKDLEDEVEVGRRELPGMSFAPSVLRPSAIFARLAKARAAWRSAWS